MVSASQQLIHMNRIGAGGCVLPKHRQVRGHLTVQEGHLLQFSARELAQAAPVRLRQQRREPVPVRTALEYPLVGEDLCHGGDERREF